MLIHAPKFALIDTSAINECARDPDSPYAKELKRLVEEGFIVPFLTEHQLHEIAQHENDEVFLSRLAFLGGLKTVASIADSIYGVSLGNILDLREHEIRCLLDQPGATTEEVVAEVRPTVRGQFHSGPEFVTVAKEVLHLFRQGFHKKMVGHAAEVANLTHFPFEDMDTPLFSDEATRGHRTPEEVKQWFETKKPELLAKIKAFGDDRLGDPEKVIEREFADNVENIGKLANDPRGFMSALCDHFGVRVDRLPVNPTLGDAGSEAIFVANLKLHAERMKVSFEELFASIRKEQLPSWVIWDGLRKKMSNAQRTSGSNLTDRFLACFGPYVDILQVDRRNKDFLRQLATSGSGSERRLFEEVFRKVPEGNGLAGLVEAIEGSH